jgi:hypothetical protein
MLTSSESSDLPISSTRLLTNANNNHQSNKLSQTNSHSKSPQQIAPPITFNRSINETTCTTVTNIPCDHIRQKHIHHKKKSETKNASPCQCSSKSENYFSKNLQIISFCRISADNSNIIYSSII